jgi:hypothetical protein
MYLGLGLDSVVISDEVGPVDQIEFKGFWQWCITLRITGVLDFVHRPEFRKRFGNYIYFRP